MRVYSALYNASDATLEGEVGFYDKDQLLGKKRFAAPAGGNLIELSYDWKATEGDHEISAKLITVGASQDGGPMASVTLSGAKAMVQVIKVELDSDHDQLSDRQELTLGTNRLNSDTDSDGLSDKQEVTLGTNPLKADSDGDGVTDKQEMTLGLDPHKADTDGDGFKDGLDTLPLDPRGGQPPAATSTAAVTSAPSTISQVVTQTVETLKTAVSDVTTGSYGASIGSVNQAVDTVREAVHTYASDAVKEADKVLIPSRSVKTVSPRKAVPTQSNSITASSTQTEIKELSPLTMISAYSKKIFFTAVKATSSSNTALYGTVVAFILFLIWFIRRRRRS